MTNPVVMVTGSNGFVGSAVVKKIGAENRSVRGVVRSLSGGDNQIAVGDIGPSTLWSSALMDVAVIVHAAARVHVMTDQTTDPLSEFRRVNVDGTLNLARQAAAQGVRRFIYISSIKVNGEFTDVGQSFSPEGVTGPVDPYAISKFEAEEGLKQLSAETGMEVVIIRPPLVYGPGVKANFLAMMRWLNKGVPLPFGAINNKRSLVALDNLVDLIATCIDHPAAVNQTFLVSDSEDLSTTELLQRMATALGRPARLLPVPEYILKAGATLLGRRDISMRLIGSLQVDISKTKKLLDWSPPLSIDDALKKTAEDFLSQT